MCLCSTQFVVKHAICEQEYHSHQCIVTMKTILHTYSFGGEGDDYSGIDSVGISEIFVMLDSFSHGTASFDRVYIDLAR